MTIVHYTNSLSAHQLPLDYELVRLVGVENFRYIYTNERLQGGAQEVRIDEPWIVREELKSRVEVEEGNPSTLRLGFQTSTKSWLENCDLLIVGGIRPIDLMERRLAAGKATFYMAERWFKPFDVGVGHRCRCSLPGWLRLFHPKYFKMALRFVELFKNPYYRFLPIGPWSAHDMALLMRVMGVGRVETEKGRERFIKWGDFVSGSDVGHVEHGERGEEIKVLWVGRMLRLKHVETIIKAVDHANSTPTPTTYTLTLVGDGPEKPYLEKLVNSIVHLQSTPTPITFLPPVTLQGVRQVMRDHDLYIFSSNGFDGWGAVVPEAMTEGMTVLGTYEAGASAALLPESNLFHCGDWRALAKMLISRSCKPIPLPYDYTPKGAAERLLKVAKEILAVQK